MREEPVLRPLQARAATQGTPPDAYLPELIERDDPRPTVAEVMEFAAQRAEQATASAVDALADARAERDEELRRGGQG